MKKYKNWQLLDELPDGWTIDKTAGSPLYQYVFCTDGKSTIGGGKRALLKVSTSKKVEVVKHLSEFFPHTSTKIEENPVFPAKTVNTLARKRFQEQLLKDIQFDLIVCEIEGWSKPDYINELKELINSFRI